jgi:ubiquinone/menaquinone biosynthesis C-methylase UbiE
MSVKGLDDTIQWYDDHAEQYAKAGSVYFDLNHIQTFTKLLSKGAKVLDAGCGPGRDADLLQEQGFKVTGLDLSAGLLKVARRIFPGIDFVQGNFLDLPFVNSSFDGVWSNTSLLHLETVGDVQKALSEMHRVLRPGGVLHVVVKAQTGDTKTAVVSDKLSGHERFFQYFTAPELTGLLEQSQFRLISAKEYNELETMPHGRPEVRLIWCLARKAGTSV